MINGIRLKICGLTSAADAAKAAAAGADYLGFVLHPQSPRRVTLERFAAMRPDLPAKPAVAVCVAPSLEGLEAILGGGFDAVQIHFDPETGAKAAAAWVRLAGRKRLWLAPRLAAADDVPEALLGMVDAFLLDAFNADQFGGTGCTADWGKFRRHREGHPAKTWILAGGLGPENIAAAVRESGADFVDVNSGIERSPGVKDLAKLAALEAALGAPR